MSWASSICLGRSVNINEEAVFRVRDWDGRKAERGILYTKAKSAMLKRNKISFQYRL